MTAHRRPLLLLVAGSCLGLQACLFIPTQATPLTPPEMREKIAAQAAKATESPRKEVFGEFPSRPGDTIATRPAPRENTVVAKMVSPANDATVPIVKPTETPNLPTLVKVGDPPGPFPIGPATMLQPTHRESSWLTAVSEYAAGHPDKAIEILKSLDAANQEFMLAVLPLLVRGATADLVSDPVGVALLVEQFHSASARLESKAALRVENVTFCTKVAGFGRYDPRPEGQPYHPNDQAQLYLEVKNLLSQPTTGPHGETHLTHARASVEIRDAHGKLIEQPDPEDWRRRVQIARFERKLYSRGSVHDFHILYPFPVPTTPGVYTVTVEVRDPLGRRVVRTSPAEFRVTGP